MDFQKDELKAGVVIVSCLAIMGLFIFNIGDIKIFKSTYEAEIVFPVANGLMEDSSVMYAGVPVGKIDRIVILTDAEVKAPDDPRVVFSISIDKSAVIKTDSVASIKTMGLMGDKYIEISPGTPSAPALPEGQRLVGDAPFDLEQLLVSGKKIVEKVEAMIDNLADFLGDKEMIASLKNTVSNFEGLAVDARGMIADNRGDIRSMIKNLALATDGLKGKLDNALGKLDSLLINTDGLVVENREDIRRIVTNFRAASADFAKFAMKIEAHPWMLLKKSPEELKADRKKK